jgi:hypothetical protein
MAMIAPQEAIRARTTLTPERRKLYEMIATLTAGHGAGDVFAALCDNLWQVAAILTESPEAAEQLMVDAIPSMVRDMRANWSLVIEAKAQSNALSGEHHA